MTRERGDQRGFTLIEIMISMALLVVGLLGVIALHATTVKGNRISRELERARVYAQQLMEDLRGQTIGYALDHMADDLDDVVTPDGVTYARDYEITNIGSLRMVTVTVTFYEDGDSSAPHTAKLQMLRTTQEAL